MGDRPVGPFPGQLRLEHDIRGRAAEIVRDRLLAANPETRPALRKRLLEIYRENEPRVLEIWPESTIDLPLLCASMFSPGNSCFI